MSTLTDGALVVLVLVGVAACIGVLVLALAMCAGTLGGDDPDARF